MKGDGLEIGLGYELAEGDIKSSPDRYAVLAEHGKFLAGLGQNAGEVQVAPDEPQNRRGMQLRIDFEKIRHLIGIITHIPVLLIGIEEKVHAQRSQTSAGKLQQRRFKAGDVYAGEFIALLQGVLRGIELNRNLALLIPAGIQHVDYGFLKFRRARRASHIFLSSPFRSAICVQLSSIPAQRSGSAPGRRERRAADCQQKEDCGSL